MFSRNDKIFLAVLVSNVFNAFLLLKLTGNTNDAELSARSIIAEYDREVINAGRNFSS